MNFTLVSLLNVDHPKITFFIGVYYILTARKIVDTLSFTTELSKMDEPACLQDSACHSKFLDKLNSFSVVCCS